MRDRTVVSLLMATLGITTVIRLAFAGLLLWAFQETDTFALRLGLWSIAISMIIYAVWRIVKFYKFMKFDKNFETGE